MNSVEGFISSVMLEVEKKVKQNEFYDMHALNSFFVNDVNLHQIILLWLAFSIHHNHSACQVSAIHYTVESCFPPLVHSKG